jgi:radical SAM superfamily enzyme YgiQ (UPF0313 family)
VLAIAARLRQTASRFKLNFRTQRPRPLETMENSIANLATALRERLAIIGDETSRRDPEKHMARLKKISERIEELRLQLPKPIHPQLAHFLERSSYDKALEFLESSL